MTIDNQYDRGPNLAGMLVFDCVARHLNFARAAEEMGVTPTAISKKIKVLESQIGIRLFNRTTRSVSLTESGNDFLQSLAPALQQIKDSLKTLGESTNKPRGNLRINTSFVAYAVLIKPNLRSFMDRYPEIHLDISLDNQLSDIVSAGFDAGVRLGHALHRDMIAVPFGPVQELIAVGSPSYIKRYGKPETPEALLNYDCIRQRLAKGRLMDWSFKKGKANLSINVTGTLIVDDMKAAIEAAVEGCGLAYVFKQFATPYIQSKRLLPLLEKNVQSLGSFYIYYPNRAQMPSKLRAFIDFIQASNWNMPI